MGVCVCVLLAVLRLLKSASNPDTCPWGKRGQESTFEKSLQEIFNFLNLFFKFIF